MVKRFPGDKIHEVIQKYPEIAEHLFQTLVGRLDHANKINVKLVNELMPKK